MKFSTLIKSCAGLLMLSACTGDKDEPVVIPETPPSQEIEPQINAIDLDDAMKKTRARCNDFSFRFFNEAVKNEALDGNDCVSPYSLFAVLSMFANGDNGVTRDQLVEKLGSGSTIEELNRYNALLLSDLQKVDANVNLKIANSVWADTGIECASSFSSILNDVYRAPFTSLALGANSGMEAINAWAADATSGLIPRFLDSPLTGTQLAILNALYFKAPWTVKFDKEKTRVADFRNMDGTVATVQMMHADGIIAEYSENEEAQILALPFADAMYYMTVFLPKEGVDFRSYASSLDAASLQMKDAVDVTLDMPRFQTESKGNITEIISKLGLTAPFTEGFDALFASSRAWLSAVMQATRINVDEDGAEGAAVTCGAICWSTGEESRHVNMRMDRPFVFAITERSSGAVLFIGQVTRF